MLRVSSRGSTVGHMRGDGVGGPMKIKVWLGTILISGMVIAALSHFGHFTGRNDRGAIAADVDKPAQPPSDAVAAAAQPEASTYDDSGFRLGEAGLSPSAR